MITEEQLAKEREPIPYIPVKRLERGLLYVIEEDIPHPLYGYAQYHKEYSVIDLRGYRKGYEPRTDIIGQYIPNPDDLFRLGTGKLPPYQPVATGNKLQSEMQRLDTYKAWRIGKEKEEVPREPVKGEQAGMLGVPGKYVEQKRPWTPGQIEIESYQKYREAMGKPKTVTPEVTVPTSVAKAIEGKTINDITIKKVRGTWWAIVKDTGFPIVGLTSKIETEAYVAKMFKLAIPKAKVPVKAETPQNLYWYSIAELKKMCQNRGLSTEGSKESLIRRLK